MNNVVDFIKKYNILIFVILGFSLYFFTLFYDFLVFDDVTYILDNQYINGKVVINFFDFFIPAFVRDDIYIPFTFIIFWLVIKIFGISSLAFHFVNVVFYILSSIALYFLLKKIINDDLISFFAIILYIIHPCHIECTAWISAMGYNISALFFFLSFLYFILAFDENKKLNYVYSILFYIFAILSQPIAITLPVILFLWAYCFRKEKLKEAIISIVFYIPFLFIYLFLYSQTVLKMDRFTSIKYNILEKFSICGFDIFNSFIPVNLCPIQPLPNLFYIILLCLFISAIYFLKNNKIFLFFLGFIIFNLLPYSNIVFSMDVPVADRYLLFISISSCVLVSYFSFYIFEKFKEKILFKYTCFVFFVVLYLFSFIFYLPVWKNDRVLFTYAYFVNPKNINCLKSYGHFLTEDKKYDEALILSNNMIENYPNSFDGYELKIKILMSKREFTKVVDLCNELEKKINNYKIYFYLFDVYINFQDYDKAELYLNIIENECKKNNLYKNEIVNLFLQKKMILFFVKAESNEFIEVFKIFSNNFKLLQDNGEFSEILNCTDYKIREEICLNYLKKYNKYSKSIIRLLNCLYVQEKYKENASEIMKSLLNDIDKAQEFINKGDYSSAEKIYLSVISKNKYMYQAYYNLGILYLQTNKNEKAKEIFRKMLNINPNDEQIKRYIIL